MPKVSHKPYCASSILLPNQYFGDRRDLFKNDLLLDLVECQQRPPIDVHSDADAERQHRRRQLHEIRVRRTAAGVVRLCRQAVDSRRRDIKLLLDLLARCGAHYLPYRDGEHFQESTRLAYFEAVPTDWLARSMVFFDPDIGLQTGKVGYMRL